ncbi:MAG: c-type cytochrome [Gammaproteobacteria bacterium]|nr:c-type cytochrome [Gammaproteobacteria bacterium]
MVRSLLMAIFWLSFSGASFAAPSQGASEPGRDAYTNKCARCHGAVSGTRTVSPSGVRRVGRFIRTVVPPLGPSLRGIFGRPAARSKSFRYSNAFLEHTAELVWTEANLDRWIADSQRMIPGSYMFLRVEAPDRRLIIDYLRGLAETPAEASANRE